MSASESAEKRGADGEVGRSPDEDKDAVIASLRSTVAALKSAVASQFEHTTTYYASSNASLCKSDVRKIPEHGMSPRHVKEMVESIHLCDFLPHLNTSSYVNIVSEPEERDIALIGAKINLADASVYPASVKLHDQVVNMLAHMWHAPEPALEGDNYVGAGTVGSTEACLLSGLALKFRWRKWYAAKHKLSEREVQGVKPNIVISSAYQAAWEKFFRYFDVDPKMVKPNLLKDKMAVNAEELVKQCDEKTIAVVAILGNHYNGVYDPVWDIDAAVKKMNAEKGYQVGIHVDAASGGFIAPFQAMGPDGPPPFDFRLDSVLSMSSSGHKFGESICGTGWVVFRRREDLAEHIAVSVTYLGGHCDSMTLNFSRPASGPYVQFYKLLRLGKKGYRNKVKNQMRVASYLREFLRDLKHPNGKPRFQILDGGDKCCLPVVAARLNPELNLKYNDIDLQHALSESHWYVSGYSLGFENFENDGDMEPLFTDIDKDSTMFRIVCKSNLTLVLAEDLIEHFVEVCAVLDSLQDGYSSMRSTQAAIRDENSALARKEGGSLRAAGMAALAAGKWMGMVEGHDGGGRMSFAGSSARRASLLVGDRKVRSLGGKQCSVAHIC